MIEEIITLILAVLGMLFLAFWIFALIMREVKNDTLRLVLTAILVLSCIAFFIDEVPIVIRKLIMTMLVIYGCLAMFMMIFFGEEKKIPKEASLWKVVLVNGKKVILNDGTIISRYGYNVEHKGWIFKAFERDGYIDLEVIDYIRHNLLKN